MTGDAFTDFAAGMLENAFSAMGFPNPRAFAALTAEVLPNILEDWTMTTAGARLVADRGKRYGHPRDNFRRIGIKWAADLDLPEPIPPHLVAIMMLDVKTCRLIETPDDQDSIDDLSGYGSTLEMLAGREPR